MYDSAHGCMTERDYYSVLGIGKTASVDDIKDAYRKLAFELHPDRNSSPEAEERFKEISNAYSVLSDPGKRALYDALNPERYEDPWEVFRHPQERKAATRQSRSYDALRSAHREEVIKTTVTLIFFLILLNAIPFWVFGSWLIIFNILFLLCIAISIYQWFNI